MLVVVKADTAEEFRAALLTELQRQFIRENNALRSASSIRDKNVVRGRINLLDTMLKFWTDVTIEPTDEDYANPESPL